MNVAAELVEKLPKGVAPIHCLVCHDSVLPFVRIIRTVGHNKIYMALCLECTKGIEAAVAAVKGVAT